MKVNVIEIEDCKTSRLSRLVFFVVILVFLNGCQSNSLCLEPCMTYLPREKFIESRPSCFAPLAVCERAQDWGKEMEIAQFFAREMDLYRAITSFKRAKFLFPEGSSERIFQIDYSILLCYYLGGKYWEALNTFESSQLVQVAATFPAFHDLLIILYDCYQQTEQEVKACRIWTLIHEMDPEAASKLGLSKTLLNADLDVVCKQAFGAEGTEYPELQAFVNAYALGSKSVRQAQVLNAVLPGAGYFYMNQKKAGLTSFLINALFTAAAYQFFHRGYITAGIITTSLEFGWYFGGINGAGLAAKEWNERLYETQAKHAMIGEKLFPVLMIQSTF